MEEKTNKIIAN